jgi:ribosomal protein S18 acetylase RimI-like enzyme
MTEAALIVDAENLSGALHLYQKMGFKIENRSGFYRKPLNQLRRYLSRQLTVSDDRSSRAPISISHLLQKKRHRK